MVVSKIFVIFTPKIGEDFQFDFIFFLNESTKEICDPQKGSLVVDLFAHVGEINDFHIVSDG